jgi:tetratricopeptide (TPR) repeat protein
MQPARPDDPFGRFRALEPASAFRPDADTVSLGRAFELVRAALEFPPEERASRLEQWCRGDDATARQLRGLVAVGLTRTDGSIDVDEVLALHSRRGPFGRYQIVECIGIGAMGVVYRAEQDSPRRMVALKLLRPGTTSDAVLRRFQREAGLLGRLHHPSIAQVFDAGVVVTERGREPFLAMELVVGPSLLQAAAPLDTAARLRLLAMLCDGIDHAHRRGVIHRDLKPENVLVEVTREGLVPRILDFGVAAAGDSRSPEATAHGQLIGTLAYMSPEQANGDIDLRSDVYSLGALGYHVLGGQPPLQLDGLSLMGALERLRTGAIVPLGRLDRRLGGDVEAVIHKALARDPELRYPSAAAFGDDLRRLLAHEPVHARRPSIVYVLSRFARRRPAVVTLLSLLAASVVLGAASTLEATWTAQRFASEAEELSRVVVHDVLQNLDRMSGTAELRQELLTTVGQRVDRLLCDHPDDPSLQRTAATVLVYRGNLLRDAGQFEAAMQTRREALALRQPLHARQPGDAQLMRELAIDHVLVGDLHKETGQHLDAIAPYTEALRLHEGLLTHNPDTRQAVDDLAWCHIRLADLHRQLGREAAALDHIRRAEAILPTLLAEHADHPATLTLRRHLAGLAASSPGLTPTEHARQLRVALECARLMRRAAPGNPNHLEQHAASALHYAQSVRELNNFGGATLLLGEARASLRDLRQMNPRNLRLLQLEFEIGLEEAELSLAVGDQQIAMRRAIGARRPLLDYCGKPSDVRPNRAQFTQCLLSMFGRCWPPSPAVVAEVEAALAKIPGDDLSSGYPARVTLGTLLAFRADADSLQRSRELLSDLAEAPSSIVGYAWLFRSRVARRGGEHERAADLLTETAKVHGPNNRDLRELVEREQTEPGGRHQR